MSTYRLHTDEIDEGEKSRDFASKEAAMAYAIWWFLDGYMDNQSMPDSPDDRVYGYAIDLIEELKRGETFQCNRFYERAHIEEIP